MLRETADRKFLLPAIVLLAFIIRFWGTGGMTAFVEDEGMQVPAAQIYTSTGHQTPDNWYHPPLTHLLLQGSLKIFGNNPYGWRMRNVVCGALSVFMIFLLGVEIFSDRKTAFLAALFMTVDPLHVLYSMSSSTVIIYPFFFLVSMYAVIRYVKGGFCWLLVSGFFLGLSIAVKWYYLPALLVLLSFTIYCRAKDVGLTLLSTTNMFLIFSLIPLSIYLLAYYPWFGRGYDLYEFVQKQVDNFRDMNELGRNMLNIGFIDRSTPIEWFMKPIVFGVKYSAGGLFERLHVYMNNFPVLILTLPSFMYVAYYAYKQRQRYYFLLVAVLIASYSVPFIAKRPIYLYSVLSVTPFAYLAIAFLIVSLLGKFDKGVIYYRIIVFLALAWGAYVYPLTTGRWYVPEFLYRPLLLLGEISRRSFLP